MDLVKNFIGYLSMERNCSKNTLETYARYIRQFLAFLKKKKISVVNYKKEHFVEFMGTLYARGLKASSVRLAMHACKSFSKFLKLEEVFKVSPLANFEGPKIDFHIPIVLSIEEVNNMLNQTSNTKKGIRDKAILELLYGSGVRVSELCKLKASDIRLEEKAVLIKGKGKKERLIPISGHFVKAWEEYKEQCTTQLAFPVSRRLVWYTVKKYAELAGITKNIYPHTLRHSFASHLLNGGAEIVVIQQMLGHADISTTGIYMHLNKEQISERFQKFHPRFGYQNDEDLDLAFYDI